MKVKRTKQVVKKIDSVELFTEVYFPSMVSNQKQSQKKNDENYGSMIAMSILEGIKKDLSTATLK